MKKIKKEEYETYKRLYINGNREGEIVFKVLSSIGFLQREGIADCEDMLLILSKEIHTILDIAKDYMNLFDFYSIIEEWSKNPKSEDLAISFFICRDSYECAMLVLRNLVDSFWDYNLGNPAFPKNLLDIDSKILLNKDMLYTLWDIAPETSAADLETFWYLKRNQKENCYIPFHIRSYILGNGIKYNDHLNDCEICSIAYKEAIHQEWKVQPLQPCNCENPSTCACNICPCGCNQEKTWF